VEFGSFQNNNRFGFPGYLPPEVLENEMEIAHNLALLFSLHRYAWQDDQLGQKLDAT